MCVCVVVMVHVCGCGCVCVWVCGCWHGCLYVPMHRSALHALYVRMHYNAEVSPNPPPQALGCFLKHPQAAQKMEWGTHSQPASSATPLLNWALGPPWLDLSHQEQSVYPTTSSTSHSLAGMSPPGPQKALPDHAWPRRECLGSRHIQGPPQTWHNKHRHRDARALPGTPMKAWSSQGLGTSLRPLQMGHMGPQSMSAHMEQDMVTRSCSW